MTARLTRIATLSAILVLGAVAAPTARADFGVKSFSTSLSVAAPSSAPAANQLVAGAHPDLGIDVTFNTGDDGNIDGGDLRSVQVDLPRGLVANPRATPTCSQAQLGDGYVACPVNSQVGTVVFDGNLGGGYAPLFNIARPEDAPAQFAFNFFGAIVKFNGRVRANGDYRLGADLGDLIEAVPVTGAHVRLWGDPGDSVHDEQRGNPDSGAFAPQPYTGPRTAFLSNPTSCGADPRGFTVAARSWRDSSRVVTATDADEPDGTPFAFTDCASLSFDPTTTVAPTTTAPDSPTGLRFAVDVPQPTSASVRAAAHLRDLRLTLPAGMAVNPSAAAGLQACGPEQIGLGSDAAATCPAASKVGRVSIATPLLEQPLTGDVYLARQGDNPFGSLLALYLVAQGEHVVIKLAGRVDADPATGQLVTTFANNPQLPFSRLEVDIAGGDRAILATPGTCGPQAATTEFTPWSGTPAVSRTSTFSIDCTPTLGAFSPGFAAGTAQALAGARSPLIVGVTRPDGQTPLNGLTLRLPTGLLATLRGVPRCSDVSACDPASRVGGAAVTAGAGTQPFPLAGDVFLTGPYKDAPFGLAVRVRVLAGPLDLGTVIVRQALFIDPDDTHVTVVSDPLPTILQGIPIRLRTLDVSVDRPDFVVNPTSCASKRIEGTLGAVDGRTSAQSVAFRVAGCGDLGLTPKLALALRGRRTGLRDGGHPALRALLTQPGGQSNLRIARVVLPLSLALDPDNAQTLCETADGAKSEPTCPKGSVVGYARATTPLLDKQLGGFVYFVKGERRTASGRVVRTLPTLVVPLSGDGVRITLRAKTAVSKNHLVTTFERIPDAPVSRFDLQLSGGKHGILVTNGNACKRSRKLGVAIRGQNGVTAKSAPTLKATCPRPKRR